MEEMSTVISVEGAPGQELGDLTAPEVPRGRRRPRRVWILRRIAIGVVTLVFVSIIVFAATQALPGNAARQILGRSQNAAQLHALQDQLGLNRSVVSQYLTWAGNVVTGNLGTSFTENVPVSKVIGSAVANSAVLVVLSTVISVIISVLIGVATAARRDGLADNAFSGFTFLFTAVPEFIIGILLVMVFATTVFQVLPAVSLIPPGSGALSHPNVYILPVATLVLAITPYLGRLVRGSMIEVLESEYVRMARLKGMTERRILYRHALPNALVPMIQGIAVTIGYLAGGIVAVEFVFGFPGVGTALLQAISERDIPVIQAVTLLLASVYVIVNLVADILVVYVSPRLRTSETL